MKGRMNVLIICIIAVLITVIFMGNSCGDDADGEYFLINCKTRNNMDIMPGDTIEIVVDVKNISDYTMGFYPVLTVESENKELLTMLEFKDGLVQENENGITVEFGSKVMESQDSAQFTFNVTFSADEIENDMATSSVSFLLNYYRKNETLSDASKTLVKISKLLLTVIIKGLI